MVNLREIVMIHAQSVIRLRPTRDDLVIVHKIVDIC